MALEPKKKKRERKKISGGGEAEKLLTISNSSWNKTITIASL